MIKVGVALLPEVPPGQDGRWAQLEAFGFAHGWSLDHLAWRAFVDEPWHATVPALAAAALSTTRLRLGTFVASPNFRHPVPFAKDLMSLDVMSEGRLEVGVGAGGPGYDAAVLGGAALTGPQRAERFEEFVTLLDLLLTQPRTSRSGTWFTAVDARMVPGPVQQPRPPLLVAGNGPRGIRLALATGDGWVTNGTVEPPGAGEGDESWWAGVAESVRRLESAAGAEGPPRGFRRVLDMAFGMGAPRSLDQVCEQIGRADRLGFTDVVIAWPRSTPPLDGSLEVLEDLGGLLQNGSLEP